MTWLALNIYTCAGRPDSVTDFTPRPAARKTPLEFVHKQSSTYDDREYFVVTMGYAGRALLSYETRFSSSTRGLYTPLHCATFTIKTEFEINLSHIHFPESLPSEQSLWTSNAVRPFSSKFPLNLLRWRYDIYSLHGRLWYLIACISYANDSSFLSNVY